MIEIKQLTKNYGSFEALKGISLEIGRGEIFGFLGVNGAGKTTTIKIMAGLLKPSSGTVKICGYDIQREPEAAKAVTGYIPDRPYMYNKLTGREFLKFMGELYKVNGKELEERVSRLLEEFSLTEWQNELIEGYSHGMKQRLATCSALIHHPKVLIVDEPMVGLDPRGARLLKDSFREYAKGGMTIFLSTHTLNVAEEVADRLAIIQGGEIIASGTLSEIREKAGSNNTGLEKLFLQLTQFHDEAYDGAVL
ncbi:MAG: ABC transporter ATP-binding protein [Candidatus Dadabacteria bacterium]|nr:MAG: ABC transporter ATP-binding protein [Candidatus Dadabacteria bacterium]